MASLATPENKDHLYNLASLLGFRCRPQSMLNTQDEIKSKKLILLIELQLQVKMNLFPLD